MSRTSGEIVALYKARKAEAGPAKARAAEVARVYDGEVTVPLPEMDKTEAAAVANWLTQGLDQLALRISSVMPQVVCAPLSLGQPRSEDYAKVRRRAITGWWDENHFERKQRKRARWLIGYAAAPAIVRPDPIRQIPVWEIRDPLCTYAAPMTDPDGMCPDDCIFAVTRRLDWLTAHYPQAKGLDFASQPQLDRHYDVIEYIDADEHVLIAIGGTLGPVGGAARGFSKSGPGGADFIELARWANLVGRCTAVVPTRQSLNKPRGQFDQMPGLYKMQARALALWLVATERAIFPDTWFISRPNETVRIVQLPDGRQGVPGKVSGGDLKEVVAATPPQVGEVIDLMERNSRVTSGVSTDFGGESPSSVRTGRAGEQLMHETVDFWVQEAQEALGGAYEEENKLAVAISRAYFGDVRKTFMCHFKGAKGQVDYIPNKHFETDENQVAWPHSGSDANGLIIMAGQRMGLGALSKRTWWELDPMIDDPDREYDRVTTEAVEQALLASINQAVLQGQVGPLEVGEMLTAIREEHLTLEEAYNRVHERIQAQAAQQAEAQQGMGGPPGAGGPPPGPGGAPGLMAPGVAAQLGLPAAGNVPGQGAPAITPGVQHMGQLFSALKGRQMPQPAGGPQPVGAGAPG